MNNMNMHFDFYYLDLDSTTHCNEMMLVCTGEKSVQNLRHKKSPASF